MSFFQALAHEIRKIRQIRPNRNIITYLLCVLIASVLWFLNALNKDYSAEISYPVRYVNFPQGKYPVTKLPGQIELEVKAKGFALLGYRIRTSFLPITLNVNSYNKHLSDKKAILEFTLNTNDIKDKISSQLSSDIKLLSISPEEIVFQFAHSQSKKVPITPDLHYTLKRQYIIYKVLTHPDSILVNGPGPIIDTLSTVYTQPIELKNLGKNTIRTIELAELPNCRYENIPIEVDIQVEQFTEAKRIIPITPRQIPDSLNIRLFPDYVNISYEVGLSKYDKVTNNDFTFITDYPGTTQDPYLEVKVQRFPPYIKNLKYTPQKVEYILEKK